MESEVVPPPDELREFTHDELGELTDNYSEDNFLGETKYAKFYRGKIETRGEVTVKICKKFIDSACQIPSNEHSRFKHEIEFLQHPKIKGHQQNLATPIGYCPQAPGVVYDTNPRGTLETLILQDDLITRVTERKHNPVKIVKRHIMVDQDCNPVLFDVGMLVGGLYGTTSNIPNGNLHGAPGYEDLHFLDVGGWSITRDVFSYGVLRMNLIARRVFDISDPQIPVALWASAFRKECRSLMDLEWIFSRVNEIFRKDPHYNVFDAYRITKLAMSCIQFLPEDHPSMKQTYESLQALHVVQRTGIGGARKSVLREFLPKEWREFIDIHRQENFLGDTQFAKLYRGMISCGAGQTRAVTVKMWGDSDCHSIDLLEKMSELMDEVYLLQHPSVNGRQQNLAKPIGYTLECQSPGIVYDLNPRDTLDKLILRDDFNWLQRIKVAAQMAHLLHFSHHYDPPFIVRNISPAHILVDKEYNPALFDFGMMVGGLFGKVRDIPKKELNFLVEVLAMWIRDWHSLWSVACDVYSFGVVLVNLFTKIVHDRARPGSALELCGIKCVQQKRTQENLDELFVHVHRKFKNDPDYDREDAFDIVRLAIHCMEFSPKDRPSTYQTCVYLRRLNAVKHFKKEFGIEDY